MNNRKICGLVVYALLIVGGFGGTAQSQARDRQNLVKNPGFELIDPQTKLPADWKHESPREEIAPSFELDSSVAHSGKVSARLAARGSEGTFGLWSANVKGIQEGQPEPEDSLPTNLTLDGSSFLGDTDYLVRCYFKTRGIDSVDRNVWIRVHWKNRKGQELLEEYVSNYADEGAWFKAERLLRAPRQARSLTLELILQWSSSGTVWWDDVSVEAAPSPSPRKIKVATVSYEPPTPSSPEKNRQIFAEKVAEAGRLGADLVCLGEGITVVSTGKAFPEVAESIPGPTSELLGEVARRYKTYVMAGIYERDGHLVYNTALLIDRQGRVAGKYRKTHLPESEITGGLTPGQAYPVFQTDFGKVGIEICYDNFFPEVARSLAVQGAEVILLPIWGDVRGDGYQWDIVARARAIDNAVFLIASNYSNKRSFIINPNGRILADTGGQSGTAIAEIDLNARTFERWLSVGSYGEWRNLFPKERRSETYQLLMTKP